MAASSAHGRLISFLPLLLYPPTAQEPPSVVSSLLCGKSLDNLPLFSPFSSSSAHARRNDLITTHAVKRGVGFGARQMENRSSISSSVQEGNVNTKAETETSQSEFSQAQEEERAREDSSALSQSHTDVDAASTPPHAFVPSVAATSRSVDELVSLLECGKEEEDNEPSRRQEAKEKRRKKKMKGEGVRRINASEAKNGRVDFVRVEDWDAVAEGEKAGVGNLKGSREELGNLKVKSVVSSAVMASSAPFYEHLVLQLQLMESKGELAVAQEKPLPPFDRWKFEEADYVQFLINQHSVHSALEEAVGEASSTSSSSSSSSSMGDSDADGRGDVAASGSSNSFGNASTNFFSSCHNLRRKEALAKDIQALTGNSIGAGAGAGTGARSYPPTACDSSSLPAVSHDPASYAAYLQRLGSQQDGTAALLKLVAHFFCLHVVHLTTGMRIGSRAVSALRAVRSNAAVAFYRDFPGGLKNPVQLLATEVNSLGSELAGRDKDVILQELPRAFQKTSLLLSVLARE